MQKMNQTQFRELQSRAKQWFPNVRGRTSEEVEAFRTGVQYTLEVLGFDHGNAFDVGEDIEFQS